jgi:GGDEF domain-containing protein
VTRKKAPMKAQAGSTVGYDEVTGVWSRAGFTAAATPLFMSCQRREAPVALAVFQFRTAGTDRMDAVVTIDRVLIAMVGQMRNAFRDCDIIGRVDTSSLAVFLADCTDDALAAVEGVRALTDTSTSDRDLVLVVGMARGTPGGTFDDLLRDARARAASIWHDAGRESESEGPGTAAERVSGGLRFCAVQASVAKADRLGS